VLEYETEREQLTRKHKQKATFQSVNDTVYQWYCLRNVPVSGPMLQAEARLIAEKLHQPEF